MTGFWSASPRTASGAAALGTECTGLGSAQPDCAVPNSLYQGPPAPASQPAGGISPSRLHTDAHLISGKDGHADAQGRRGEEPLRSWRAMVSRRSARTRGIFSTVVRSTDFALANVLSRKPWAHPMVLRGFAVHAGHVFHWLTCHRCSKPIEESHSAGLARIEPVQHMRSPAVV